MAVINVDNLYKSYGDTNVIQDLSLTVEDKGNVIGILGPNGVGKTTFLEILTGQRPQDSGGVTVLGNELPEESMDLKYKIGVLPEKEAPPSFLTAREYLTFVGQDRGLDEETVEERIEYWSELLQYADVLDILGSDLSRGQQQKVMITQAFIHSPELVFIDEPLANLDPIIQSIFIEELQNYVDSGNTIVVSTHQVDFALDLCSELHLFSYGDNHHKIDEPSTVDEEKIISLLRGGE